MLIQWYPGHMTKAKRAMQEDVKKVDLVIELLDARIPYASRNPDIDGISHGKFRLILLNKADLADEETTKRWIRFFNSRELAAIALDSRSKNALKEIDSAILNICREKLEKDRKRGILNRRIKAMVAGIPNVGKSTFINSMSGKSAVKTGNLPGVTRGNQWIRLNRTVELLDTPGILWPKFEDEHVGIDLALAGSVHSEIIEPEALSLALIRKLAISAPEALKNRYALSLSSDDDPYAVLVSLCKIKNCLKKQAEPDTERMARQLLDDFKNGKLGRISLEDPSDYEGAV